MGTFGWSGPDSEPTLTAFEDDAWPWALLAAGPPRRLFCTMRGKKAAKAAAAELAFSLERDGLVLVGDGTSGIILLAPPVPFTG